ncbi:hypothetical protein Q3G72_019572 [Acer saccharum]|nr:hypothetical protein Q3G72_019572 [Acer saccharum]
MADEHCNTGLGLRLGFGEYVACRERSEKGNNNNNNKAMDCNLDFSFSLCPKEIKSLDDHVKHKQTMVEDQDYHVNINCDYSNNNKNTTTGRKKLRLTKQQSTLLEGSFKLHTTLNQSQKQSLAEQLNLKPRQVEVWFQNRRARTKLKQTEVDCEFLKKCCESLSDENKRLKKEVQELQSLKEGGGSQFIQQLPKAAMCPSCCDKIMKKNEAAVIDHVVLKNNKWHSSYNGTN